MPYLSNASVNRLNIHSGLHTTALSLSGNFFTAFLLSRGFTIVGVLWALATILALRFVLRPMILYIAPRLGSRCTLYFGCFFYACQYLMLAWIDGVSAFFLLFCVISALSDIFYWTPYHAIFAYTSDDQHRGKQISAREALNTVSTVIAPLVAGFAIDHFGAPLTFGVAAAVELCAILPLRRVPDLPIADTRPKGAYNVIRQAGFLFSTDGWIAVGHLFVWAGILFYSTGSSFTNYGGALALAGLVSACGGLFLGRIIDAGHAQRAVFLNGGLLIAAVLLKACAGPNFAGIYAIVAVTSLLGASYNPMLMTSIYSMASKAPCTLRSVFVTEGAWDIGGILACLLSIVLLNAGAGLGWAILLAIFGAIAQILMLHKYYATHRLESSRL